MESGGKQEVSPASLFLISFTFQPLFSLLFSDEPPDVGPGRGRWSRAHPHGWLGPTHPSLLRADPQHSAVEVMNSRFASHLWVKQRTSG